MKQKILIAGAGGFIGGHLVKYLRDKGKYDIVCADIKPLEYWFQLFDNNKNFSLDLKDYENCLKVSKDAHKKILVAGDGFEPPTSRL